MSSLDGLDKPSATLRILLELNKEKQGINVTKLYEIMKSYGAGRTAIDTSRKALTMTGLVEEYETKGRSTNFKVLSLTPLGESVTEKIVEIEGLMNKK